MTIRRQPQDFRVTERLRDAFVTALAPAHSRGSPHAVFELTKTSLTTPEAVQRLAKSLNIKSSLVEYAGLKDKHAVTTQHVSARLQPQQSPLQPETGGAGWHSRLLGWSPHPITAQDIATNAFDIVVRDLSHDAIREMDQRANLLRTADNSLLFINYFGDQRFGSARHGEGFAAVPLLKGDFESALKLLIATPARKDAGSRRHFTRAAARKWGNWPDILAHTPRLPERRAIEVLAEGGCFRDAFASLPNFLQQLTLDAFQSSLWNSVARRIALALSPGEAIIAHDDYGDMVFPPCRVMTAPWLGLDLPLPHAALTPAAPWSAALGETLAAVQLSLADLKVPGLRRPAFADSSRPLAAQATAFIAGAASLDDLSSRTQPRLKRTLSFELPSGSYATVVLRALGQ